MNSRNMSLHFHFYFHGCNTRIDNRYIQRNSVRRIPPEFHSFSFSQSCKFNSIYHLPPFHQSSLPPLSFTWHIKLIFLHSISSPPLTAVRMDSSAAVSAGKSYWRFGKEDFYPEPTFRSFSTYLSALSNTPPPRRLRDRLLGRSSDADELVRSKKQSENEMKKCLRWWDLIWLGFGSVVGSGVFSITGQETHDHAGPAIALSYVISGLSALLSVFCYTEFAVEIPVAGGSFSYLRVKLGDFIAFIAAGNILLEGLVGSAGLGRSWSSYLAGKIKSDPDSLRIRVDSFANGFNLLDPLAVVVLIIVNGFAMKGRKRTSVLNWISCLFGVAVIVLIVVTGFIHGKKENLVPFSPYGAEGFFTAAAVV